MMRGMRLRLQSALRIPANSMSSEIRKDYIQEKYVIIAPRRGERPYDISKEAAPRIRKARVCAFCPEHPDHPAGLYSLPEDVALWKIKVAANKYPAVSLDNEKAYGVQEVVIETPEHAKDLEELPSEHIGDLLRVYAARTGEITKNDKIEYVLIFKNQGGKAGASLEHAHSQIFATAFIPPHLIDKSLLSQKYKLERGSCVYCDVIAREEAEGSRLIHKDADVIAFCPYASMYNYEVWVMPIRHLDNITLLNDEERLAWAAILKKALAKIVALGLDYNYYFHQVVNDEDQHFYMKITPRGSTWAGVEIGSGVVINPVAPEDAARCLKEV